MTANWNNPTNSSTYTNLTSEITNRDLSVLKMDPSGDSNIPTGAIYLNQTSKQLEKYNGSSFAQVFPLLNTWGSTIYQYASMTVSSQVYSVERYAQIGKIVFCEVYFTCTTGGTAADHFNFSLPMVAANTGFNQVCPCSYIDGGSVPLAGTLELPYNSTEARVRKYDGSNWGLGTLRTVIASFCYEST